MIIVFAIDIAMIIVFAIDIAMKIVFAIDIAMSRDPSNRYCNDQMSTQ